jgi:hypothetical protein
MARNRMLKKDFFGDPKVGELPLGCRLLFQSLWIHADDTGHGIAAPQLLKAQCFPYDSDITAEQVHQWMEGLSTAGMVLLYDVAGQKYYFVVNFAKHQIINRPSQFAFPRPTHSQRTEDSVSPPTRITDESGNAPVALIDESKRERGKVKRIKGSADAPGDFENRKIADPRFEPIRNAFLKEFATRSPSVKAPFEPSDGKMLNELLRRQPNATANDLTGWLANAFASDDVPPLRRNFRLREFASHAEKFAHGPLLRGTPRAAPKPADAATAAKIGDLVL